MCVPDMQEEGGAKDTFHRFYTNENVKVGGFGLRGFVSVFFF